MSPNPRVNSQDSLFLRAGDRVEGSSWSSFPADVSTTCSWFSLASAAACSVFLRILLSSHSLMLKNHRAPILRPLCPHSVSGNLNQPHGFKKYLETASHLVYLSRPSLFPEGQANASSRLPDFSAVASKQSLLLPRLFTAYRALLSTSLDSFPFPFTPCNESISTAARFSWRIHPDTTSHPSTATSLPEDGWVLNTPPPEALPASSLGPPYNTFSVQPPERFTDPEKSHQVPSLCSPVVFLL